MNVRQKADDFNQKNPKLQFSIVANKTLKNLKSVINKKTVEELAWESKLIQRTSSKIMGFDFLTTMLLASLDAEHATLTKISDLFLSTTRHITITSQSIMERLNSEAAPRFFKMVFENILKKQLDSFAIQIPPKLLACFTKVLLQDSSSMDLNPKLSTFFKGSGGRASKACAKIDVIYDFKAKRLVGTIYRLRWQIELLYKSWKSGLKIDYLKGINPHRIVSLFYVRMIMILIINEVYKLMDYIGCCTGNVVSMHKVYNWMKCAKRLQRILNGKLIWWEERHLTSMVARSMSKQKRKDKKTSLQAIYEGDFYYQKAS